MAKKTKEVVTEAAPHEGAFDLMLKGYGPQISRREIPSPAASDTIPTDQDLTQRHLLQHPVPFLDYLQWAEVSDILAANISAYVSGVWGYGYDASAGTDDVEEDRPRHQKEKERILNFFRYCNVNYSWEKILVEQFGPWYAATGNGYLNFTRDFGGKLRSIHCLPPHLMWCTKEDDDPIMVPTKTVNWETGEEEIQENYPRRFRRYALYRNGRYTWYKQLGDPRVYDMRTGEENPKCPFKYRAQEILHISEPCSWSHPYGIPRWIGALYGISNARDGEIVNQELLQNSCMPIVVIMVSGGKLTPAAVVEIRNMFRGNGGPRNYHRILTLEAEPFIKEKIYNNSSGESTLKIDVKTFSQVVPEDALFLKAKQACNEYTTATFRHSKNATGMFIGSTTGEEIHALMARDETQVYQPARMLFDSIINQHIVEREIGAKKYRYVTKAPRIRDARIQAEILEKIARTGTLTRYDLKPMLEEVLGCPIITGDEWYNKVPTPIVPTMLQTGNFPGGTPNTGNDTQGHTYGAIGKNKPGAQVTAQPMSDNTALQNLRKSIIEEIQKESPDVCQALFAYPNGEVEAVDLRP